MTQTDNQTNKAKTAKKVGRNPFETREPEVPRPAETHRREESHQEQPRRASRKPLLERLDGALSWKLKQFSLFKYESGSSAGQVSLLSLGLENPRWKSRRTWDLKLIRSRSLVLSALSIRIHSA